MNNDLEKKWREEYRLLGFMDGDEIYLAARKAAHDKHMIDKEAMLILYHLLKTKLGEFIDVEKFLDEHSEETPEGFKYHAELVEQLKDRDQEIKRLKKENSILYRSHNKICKQLYYGEHLDMDWVKSIIQEEVVHPVIASCLKVKDSQDRKLKEREELIKEMIPYIEYAIKYSTPLSQKKADELLEKARKLTEEVK